MSGIIDVPGVSGSNSGVISSGYEVGEWTPATSTSAYAISSSGGKYTKIGKQVFIQGHLTLSGVDSSSNSTFVITGLPFTAHADFAGIGGVRSATSGAFYLLHVGEGSTVLRFGSMDGMAHGSNVAIATHKYFFTTNYLI